MLPVLVFSHAAAALIAAAGAAYVIRRRHRQEIRRLQVANDALRADLQRAHGEIEALMPQAMQALGLETTLTLTNAEHARAEAASAAELESCRRRLVETESMTVSLQQALVDARAELAAAQAPRGWQADLAGQPAANVPTLAQLTGEQSATIGKLDELKSRLADIVSASRKWQRGGNRNQQP